MQKIFWIILETPRIGSDWSTDSHLIKDTDKGMKERVELLVAMETKVGGHCGLFFKC